jgi:signal transduction histidine kinase
LHTVYLRVYRKEFGITVSPELCDPVKGITFRWTDYFFLSVIVFNLLFIVIGLIIKYQAKTKQILLRELDWFLLYTGVGFLYLIAASGYGSLYIWGSYPWFEINAAIFFGALSSFGFLHFCKYALGIHKRYKYISWWFDTVAMLYLLSAILGFGLYHGMIPSGLLGGLLGLFYLGMLSCIAIVVILALKKVFVDRDKNFIWFLGIFVFHIAFVVIVMGLEIGTIVYNFKMHAWLTVLCYFPQMAVTLGFLSNRFVNALEEKSRQLQILRKDIAQDIHDEIGSQLTKISLSSHLISLSPLIEDESLKSKILGLGQEAVTANAQLRELLFAIHPTSDNFDVVQAFFRETASNYFENANIIIHFDMKKQQQNPLLDRIVKSQLILIYKEILTNIAKHANANNIWIKFVLMNEDQYRLEVRDDGIGFDQDKKISKGMGLKSIEDRCAKIVAKCKMDSKLNQGTEIQIHGNVCDQFVSS